MAFLTHQLQGLYTPSRPSLKRVDINLSKHTPCLCEESSLINRIKRRSLRISSFKGRMQSDEYKDGLQESGINSAKLPNISNDNEGTLSGLPKVHNRLFKSWLTFLPSDSPNQDQTLEGPSSNERLETDMFIKGGILKTVWSKLLDIDATIKIPAIIIIPLFLTVNMKYGPQVARELIPLWICGPLLISLYIKMVQVLYSLYVFSFKQSVKVVKNFTSGNDKELLWVRLWKHVVYFRNLDYKNESKRIWKEFKEWLGDKCLDYVESMWSYRGMVGFLKIASIM